MPMAWPPWGIHHLLSMLMATEIHYIPTPPTPPSKTSKEKKHKMEVAMAMAMMMLTNDVSTCSLELGCVNLLFSFELCP